MAFFSKQFQENESNQNFTMVNHIPKLNGESACGPDGFSGFFPKLLGGNWG